MHRSLINEFSESLPVTDEDNAMHNSEFGIQEEEQRKKASLLHGVACFPHHVMLSMMMNMTKL